LVFDPSRLATFDDRQKGRDLLMTKALDEAWVRIATEGPRMSYCKTQVVDIEAYAKWGNTANWPISPVTCF